MTTTTMRRAPGGERWRTADQHLLNMPRAARDAQAEEQELAARAVHRIAGQDAAELLDILGLTPPAETPHTHTKTTFDTRTKRCTRCQQDKPLTDFYKQPETRDGLRSHCKTCHNKFRNAVRTRRNALTPGGRGISCARDAIDNRLNAYKQLILGGATIRGAAKELGVGERTAHRYHAQLRQRGEL